jgi:integrase/recombinase XerD
MKLQDLIAEYIGFRQSMGQKFTSSGYPLKAFGRLLGENFEVQDVDPDSVLSFLGTPATCYWHRKHQALVGFYRYAGSRGHVAESPLPKVVPKPPPRFVPYVYTHAEVRRLLDATNSYAKTPTLLEPHTFRAVLLLLFGAGLRISECLSLAVADVDLMDAQLVIHETKFYKSRIVPLGSHLKVAMVQYAEQRRNGGHAETPEKPFFVGRMGAPLTKANVQQQFRRLRVHAGICRTDNARYQPRLHDLRHAFAVNRLIAAYKAGADVQKLLPKLSTFLGHISLSSTQLYLTMTPALLQEASVRFERYMKNGDAHE